MGQSFCDNLALTVLEMWGAVPEGRILALLPGWILGLLIISLYCTDNTEMEETILVLLASLLSRDITVCSCYFNVSDVSLISTSFSFHDNKSNDLEPWHYTLWDVSISVIFHLVSLYLKFCFMLSSKAIFSYHLCLSPLSLALHFQHAYHEFSKAHP